MDQMFNSLQRYRTFKNFTTTYGFTFDDPPASPIAGIPTALTWHRNSDDPNDIYFERRSVVSQSSGNGDSVPSSSDTTQRQGTLSVTFPSAGRYVIEVLDSQTDDVIGSSHSLTVVSQVQDIESSISVTGAPSFTFYVTSASSPTASSAREQNSSVYDPIISTPSANPASSTSSPPSRSGSPGSNSNRHHQLSIIIGATIGSVVFLLLLLGIGVFLFTRKHAPHYGQSIVSFCPPDDEGKSRSISPVIPVGTAVSSTNFKNPDGKDRRRNTFGQESRPLPVDPQIGGSAKKQARPRRQEALQSAKGKRIKFARVMRNSFCTVSEPLPVDSARAREQAGPGGEEMPRAALGDMEAEVLRLKTQVYQILIQREAERVEGGPFDLPPSYVEIRF
ncbi:hypothetical protein EDD85DRAFT_940610 [Armillaria nabsnona]|nr:hypothetical protein EDD85DRAFT_940610 [Armillaria nabsnona]